MDFIHINALRINTVIGCTPAERERRQGVTLDIAIGLDLSRAAKSDSLADTVDYAEIEEKVHTLVSGSEFRLVEGLAGAVGDLVLAYGPVRLVRVRVEKPGGARHARSVTAELEFRKD